ncbi:hypothetical protein EV677_2634 [Herminiimonas fonticola]|uniref:Uncharacterized protein n=1 Tax=Herminiimonas fonticola TaxID=303380 RepID=A0A4R6G3W4_9BURK|nr:hypothetical protein Hfont_2669 [Herminiimonas fonticola]TDN89043.1 hypothetical protein EV677_2634 [Herminiimonas fonticola]
MINTTCTKPYQRRQSHAAQVGIKTGRTRLAMLVFNPLRGNTNEQDQHQNSCAGR